MMASARPTDLKPITTLLIANRGEIACRIIVTAQRLGIKTVAVFSDADAGSLHCHMANVAVRIGGNEAGESYLNIEAIIAACLKTGANAVHPGYGFLAENPQFSQACIDAGIIFVGPSPKAIHALGNKVLAKQLAREVGVPVLVGSEPTDQSDAALEQAAQQIGYPLMIKAAAGGGGRGMRLVISADDFIEQAKSARIEAITSFASEQLLLERAALNARHIEIQILADQYGNVIHCGERDCSTQRRNQKIIEEAPAPDMPESLRVAMGDAAIKLAQAVQYSGAGTVEFLVENITSSAPQFWFLEVNTRLQVEHPVTEAITGLDLVEQQLLIAAGHALRIKQSDVRLKGHAIELRLCAEDTDRGFIPQTGTLTDWPSVKALSDGLHMPVAEFSPSTVRLDSGVETGSEITPFYDSMLAKLIVHADDREAARQLAILALRQLRPVGLKTNRDSLLKLLQAAPFANAQLSTQWLSTEMPTTHPLDTAQSVLSAIPNAWHVVAAVLWVHASSTQHGPLQGFASLGAPCFVTSDETTIQILVRPLGGLRYAVTIDGSDSPEILCALCKHKTSPHITGVQLNDQFSAIWHTPILDDQFYLDYEDHYAALTVSRFKTREHLRGALDASAPSILSSLHGRVSRVLVSAGAQVKTGDCLMSIESMKMEHQILAQRDAQISAIAVAIGDQVSPQQLLMTFAT